MAITIGTSYGGSGCPCKWMTDYGGPEQRTECRSYGPAGQYCSPNQLAKVGLDVAGAGHWAAGCVGVGGICGPEGDASNSEWWHHSCRFGMAVLPRLPPCDCLPTLTANLDPTFSWVPGAPASAADIAIKNITFRRLKGTVQAPGQIQCRKGNPCTVHMEDVDLKTAQSWRCGNAQITRAGTVTPALPDPCPVGPT